MWSIWFCRQNELSPRTCQNLIAIVVYELSGLWLRLETTLAGTPTAIE